MNRRYTRVIAVAMLVLTLITSWTLPALARKKSNYVPPAPAPMPSTAKKVLGFTTYYYSGDKSSLNSMNTNYSAIDMIATATHITDGTGNITGMVPSEQITFANGKNIPPYVLIGNNFDGSVAKKLLESDSNRKAFTTNLLALIKENGYKGVNIDLEGVYPEDRSYYTNFLNEVFNALHPLGYAVTVSIPAKVSDSPANSWNGAYDYAAIGKIADLVLLMAYDEHYPGGAPGAIASIGWVTKVINYAVTVIPKEKLLLGTGAYGYDWSANGTKAYSINGCYNLAAANGAVINWDDATKSPWFKYTDSTGAVHTVWFENGQSLSYKLDLVNSNSIAGIGIWRLGLENTDFWNTIKNKFGR